MTDTNKLTFVKIDNTYGRLVTDNISILEAVFKKFAVPVDNYWFMPAYRAGRWDGKIHFVQRNGMFYIGTFKLIYNYVNTGEYEIEIDPGLLPEKIEKNELVSNYMLANEERLNPQYVPYVYQTRAALKSLYHRRAIMEHCTSSGKSLTIFLVVNYLLKYNPDMKFLILVPKLDLVEQITENLIDFGMPPDLVGKFCGFQKDTEQPIIVSTWQSMHKQKKFLKDFTVFIADECLHPDSLISMSNGTKKKIKDINEGEMVITKNENTGEIEIKPVKEVYHNMSLDQQMYELEFENGKKLKITGNHKVMLSDGSWKKVDELNGDEDLEWHGLTGDIYC